MKVDQHNYCLQIDFSISYNVQYHCDMERIETATQRILREQLNGTFISNAFLH